MPELYEPESDEAPPVSQTVPHRSEVFHLTCYFDLHPTERKRTHGNLIQRMNLSLRSTQHQEEV